MAWVSVNSVSYATTTTGLEFTDTDNIFTDTDDTAFSDSVTTAIGSDWVGQNSATE